MKKRIRRILKWTRWILLTIILLPVVSLILIKLTGSMKLRKSNDQILGALYNYPINKIIDTIAIGNRNIVYLRTSKRDSKAKEAVLFVHGSPGSLDAFVKYMHDDSLLAQADLVAYDRPGFGHSDFGKSLTSLRRQAATLQSLMKKLGYERYWLVGHSYGGAVIIQAAIDDQRKIAGMAIIAGSVVYEIEPVAAWRKWVNLPFIKGILPFALRVSNEELMSLRRDLRMIDDDWNSIRVPVSLIHGKEDILVPFENLELAKEKLVTSDSVRTVVFNDENHFILWTRRDSIIGEIHHLMNIK